MKLLNHQPFLYPEAKKTVPAIMCDKDTVKENEVAIAFTCAGGETNAFHVYGSIDEMRKFAIELLVQLEKATT